MAGIGGEHAGGLGFGVIAVGQNSYSGASVAQVITAMTGV